MKYIEQIESIKKDITSKNVILPKLFLNTIENKLNGITDYEVETVKFKLGHVEKLRLNQGVSDRVYIEIYAYPILINNELKIYIDESNSRYLTKEEILNYEVDLRKDEFRIIGVYIKSNDSLLFQDLKYYEAYLVSRFVNSNITDRIEDVIKKYKLYKNNSSLHLLLKGRTKENLYKYFNSPFSFPVRLYNMQEIGNILFKLDVDGHGDDSNIRAINHIATHELKLRFEKFFNRTIEYIANTEDEVEKKVRIFNIHNHLRNTKQIKTKDDYLLKPRVETVEAIETIHALNLKFYNRIDELIKSIPAAEKNEFLEDYIIHCEYNPTLNEILENLEKIDG